MPHTGEMRHISREVLPADLRPPKRLYHYTTQRGLLGILKSKTLWATRIQYLNDSSEFGYTLPLWTKAVEVRQRRLRESSSPTAEFRSQFASLLGELPIIFERFSKIPIYVVCFSEDGDSLDQWRAYCPSGPGFSIGFNSEQTIVTSTIKQHCFIAPCIYDPARQMKLVDALCGNLMMIALNPPPENVKRTKSSKSKFEDRTSFDYVFLASVFKNPSFKSEKEWRVVTRALPDKHRQLAFREGRHVPIPHYVFELSSPNKRPDVDIIVGPNSQMSLAIDSVNMLLRNQGWVGSARPSAVPLRDI